MYAIFKGYTSFTVITEYWLYSPCCRIHPCSLSYTLYLCICFFFVMFTGLLYFLDSTCKLSYNICLSLTYFTQHNALQVHPCCCKWQDFVLLYGLVFHCVCMCMHIHICVCVYIHVYTTSSLSVHLLMDTQVASISWQL